MRGQPPSAVHRAQPGCYSFRKGSISLNAGEADDPINS